MAEFDKKMRDMEKEMGIHDEDEQGDAEGSDQEEDKDGDEGAPGPEDGDL